MKLATLTTGEIMEDLANANPHNTINAGKLKIYSTFFIKTKFKLIIVLIELTFITIQKLLIFYLLQEDYCLFFHVITILNLLQEVSGWTLRTSDSSLDNMCGRTGRRWTTPSGTKDGRSRIRSALGRRRA